MKKGRVSRLIIFFVLLVVFISVLVACKPPENQMLILLSLMVLKIVNIRNLTRDGAIDRATGALDNLLDYLTARPSLMLVILRADHVNTEDGSAFRLKLRGNMYNIHTKV